VLEVETPLGPARAHLWSPPGRRRARGRLVLGHGAGGGINAADLVAAQQAAVALGWQAVLVEQPWRVAGRRVAPAPARLDVGWTAVLTELEPLPPKGVPLVVGGRSAGARVACRTASALGAQAVCLLAFPLHPPGRPEKSRAGELESVGVPALVIQGQRDPFGTPEEIGALGAKHVTVVGVPGDHALARSAAAAEMVAEAVRAQLTAWFRRMTGPQQE